MQKVTVYYFTGYNIRTDQVIRSKRMATLETIKRFGCAPLMDTAKDVDASTLDAEGRYEEKEKNE